jgi:hypothetical protein
MADDRDEDDGVMTEAEAVDKADPPNGRKLRERGEKWLERIQKQIGIEKSWRDKARSATAIYAAEAESGQVSTFNILHSNVETIVPSIYNSTPSPDVRRRFGDPDDSSKLVADIIERGIKVHLDNGALDGEIEAAAQDAFIAGRGVVRIRVEGDDFPKISYEVVPWDDYVEGPAKRWRHVPWVAFRHELVSDECEKVTSAGYLAAQTAASDGEKLDGEVEGSVKVWEIWDKSSRKVLFVRDRDGLLLSEKEDPLGFDGFFPNPEPAQPITITGRRMPVNPFSVYRELADELDLLTKRIKHLTKGMKARGAVAAGEAAEDVKALAEADDNTLTEIRGVEMAAQAGGLDKLISWWPIENIATVIQRLSEQREITKQAIYEITGISDIVRGASSATETATAQQIKTQWGSLRIKKMQRMIESTVRDLFQMTADLMGRVFTPEQLQQITSLNITDEAIGLLQQPLLRNFRVDVESDSTVRADVSRNQQEMNTFLQGTAQFIQAVGPAVQSGVISKQAAIEIYSAFARSFKLGKQAEDMLDNLTAQAQQEAQNPPQQGPTPEQIEEEKQKAGREIDLQRREAALKIAEERLNLNAEKATHGVERKLFDADRAMGERQREVEDRSGEVERNGEHLEAVRGEIGPALSAIQSVFDAIAAMRQDSAAQTEAIVSAVLSALNAPRTVTLPDGRMVTSQSVVN